MKELTCCFTGHRIISKQETKRLEKQLYVEVESLINKGILYFGCGGALGFDMLAAETVISLKEKYGHIRLILVLPCKEQNKYWNEKDKERYLKIIDCADKVIFTSEQYFSGCMQKRNRHLVDHSSVCVAYMRKNTGGTAYTVDYARGCGVELVLL